MIEIRNLVKRFGPFTAVDGISFSVSKGEILGFLGPNGAGKSTTMKMVTGFLVPSAGSIEVLGHNVANEPRAVQEAIGYLPEGAPSYGDMTPGQFLDFIADARHLPMDTRAASIASAVERTQIGDVLTRPIDTLSKGFKRRVGLAQAILHDPPVLILDEPTDGLDPNQKHAVRELITSMSQDKAIVLSTHILEEVEAICTRAIIIDGGKIVADGTPSELITRSRYHNAITFVVRQDQLDRAREAARRNTDILGHEEREAGDGMTALTIFPRDGRNLVETTPQMLKDKEIDAIEYRVEVGRLDEVFRTLTTPDTAEHKAQVSA